MYLVIRSIPKHSFELTEAGGRVLHLDEGQRVGPKLVGLAASQGLAEELAEQDFKDSETNQGPSTRPDFDPDTVQYHFLEVEGSFTPVISIEPVSD